MDTGQFLTKQIAIVNSCVLIIISMVYSLVTVVIRTDSYSATTMITTSSALPLLLAVAFLECFFTYQQVLDAHCMGIAKSSSGVYTCTRLVRHHRTT